MCLTPSTLPETGIQVACRKCRLCNENRVKDWVGRCMAEVRNAAVTHSVTFTYGPKDGRENHEAAAILTYSHIQNMFKKLRRDGYPLRYLVAGEYGSRKGRAHWHAMFFWQEKAPPEIVLDKRVNYDWWPHGFTFVEAPHVHAIQYVCKYINKDQGDEGRQGKLAMSKRPVLGGLYFKRIAELQAKSGMAPQSPFYTFPEVRLRNGKMVQFYLRRAASEFYVDAWLDAWAKYQPGRVHPASQYIEEVLDKRANYIPGFREFVEPPPDDDQVLARKRFDRMYREHYFGRTLRGLYDPEWWSEQMKWSETNEQATFKPPAGYLYLEEDEWPYGADANGHWI